MNSERERLTHAQRAAHSDTAGDRARIGQTVEATRESALNRRPVISSWQDTYQLLAFAASFDGRERGRHEAEAWLEALRGTPVADVKEAITIHYRQSTYPIMPANVIQILEEGAP